MSGRAEVGASCWWWYGTPQARSLVLRRHARSDGAWRVGGDWRAERAGDDPEGGHQPRLAGRSPLVLGLLVEHQPGERAGGGAGRPPAR